VQRDNQKLYEWLMSRENLTGGHTILMARAEGKS
jgi:hypothetical protein